MRLACGVLFALCALAQERAEYAGGTLAEAPQGKGRMDLTDARWLSFRAGEDVLRIAYERVNLLEYGQQVSRRVGMAVVISPLLILSKARKHFLTIGYTDSEGRQQAAVFRLDKRSVRPVLSGLEARTGRRIEYTDVEARKAGK